MQELLINRRRTGVFLRPARTYSGMWQICRGDEISDMVNLTRAKDAAISWAGTGYPGGIRHRVSWRAVR